MEEQLNCVCDGLAKRSVHRSMARPVGAEERYLLPGEKAAVFVEGEKLTKQAVKDYNRGRSYLSDFANREGVPVFDEIQEALECVISKCRATK